MRQGINQRNPSKGEIEVALNRIDNLADGLLRSNQTCLICMNDGAMRNGHIVGEKFLELIASTKNLREFKVKPGAVYCWPTSARSIGRLALPAVNELIARKRLGPIEIDRYLPVSRSKNHKDCKFTFTCCTCDNEVLKLTDSIQGFDPQDEETAFKFGLRTFAAYTAWYDGHKRWAKEGLVRNLQGILLLKQFPFLRSTITTLSDWGARQTALGKHFESETRRWRRAYTMSSWDQAANCVIDVSIKPRIAGCGVGEWYGYPVAVTILPKKNGRATILTSTLLDDGAPPSLSYQQCTANQQLAQEWARRFENQPPAQWLPAISRLCEFLYMSPEDYHDDRVVSETARHAIATAIGARISAIPDLLTEDPGRILREQDPP